MPHAVSNDPPLAVVGLHGRFPSSPDLRGFWDNLAQGREAIQPVPAERWDDAALSGEAPPNRGGFIPFADCFDHRFFGILPREAETMDPQQRLFLQTAWAALEDAGHPPGLLAGRRVGVFVGIGHADYPGLMRRDGVPLDIYHGTGIALTAVANRVSFLLDFHGPSEGIDTACSSSLVAIHRAVRSIHAGECEMAVAGGVNLLLAPDLFVAFAKAGMLGPSGRCRTFDAAADGYVRGEGVGALVLRPLAAAERDGDFIYGVIRGSAVNHGGRAHSFTAPNVKAQADVVREAWRRAAVPLRNAALIETHGTGTPLGDPIEVNGLKKALAADTSTDGHGGPILLGALKSHIGHLEAAAGIAAVIRALLAMRHGNLPANRHCATLNPHIQLAGTPFVVPTRDMPLGFPASAVFAGVSAFGFGGVNAHVVLQSHAAEPGPASASASEDRPYLFMVSAKDGAGLIARARQLAGFLAEAEDAGVSDADLLARLCRALDVPPTRARGAEPVALAALGIMPERFAAVLRHVGAALGRDIGMADIRDCVTLTEVAQRLARPVSDDGEAPGRLGGRVALPPRMTPAATPARIAYSLQHGRDAMPERLGVVAASRRALLDALSRFLADPSAADWGWVRGSVRAKTPPVAKPQPAAGWPDESRLIAWADHWVHTKGAAPRWNDLYGDAAVPGRVPLPAYPFTLDRVWYTPAARPDTAAARGPLDHWCDAWATSRLRAPSSVLALAAAVEHRVSGAAEGWLRLTDVVFGPPMEVAPEDGMTCRTIPGIPSASLQCVSGGASPRVLLQARLGAGGLPVELPVEPPPYPPLGRIKPAAVHEGLAEGGVVLAEAFRCAQRFAGGPGVLAVDLTLARQGGEDGFFWVSLLVAALAGLRHLKGGGDALLLPWRIATLDFDAAAAREVRQLVIRAGGDGSPATLRVVGKDGAPALVLAGVQLRAATPMVAHLSDRRGQR